MEAYPSLNSWYQNITYSSVEEQPQLSETDLNPDTINLDRALTIQHTVIMLNHYLKNEDFMYSKYMLNRFEMLINKSYSHILKHNSLFNMLRTIVTKLITNFHQLITHKELTSSLMNIFHEIAFRKSQDDTQYTNLYEELDIQKHIQLLKEQISQLYYQGIKRRKAVKNHKIRIKKNLKLQRNHSRNDLGEIVLPVKRSNPELSEKEITNENRLIDIPSKIQLPLEWEIQFEFVNEFEKAQRMIDKMMKLKEREVEKWYIVEDENRENDVLVPVSKNLSRFYF